MDVAMRPVAKIHIAGAIQANNGSPSLPSKNQRGAGIMDRRARAAKYPMVISGDVNSCIVFCILGKSPSFIELSYSLPIFWALTTSFKGTIRRQLQTPYNSHAVHGQSLPIPNAESS